MMSKIEIIYRVSNQELKRIQKEMKTIGFTLLDLNKMFNGAFRSSLYAKCSCTITGSQRIALEKRLRREIEIIDSKQTKIVLQKNERVAELTGIILGDGCINIYNNTVPGGRIKEQSNFSITLNGVDDKDYVDYVNELLKEVFGMECSISKTSGKAVQMRYQNKTVVNSLLDIGLITGNKVKNQVSVPDWIKIDKQYSIACLRGLLDTDGCIHVHKRDKIVHVIFCNNSFNLLIDFCKMCNSIGIRTTRSNRCEIRITSIKDVRDFIKIVKPFKWNKIKNKIMENDELRRKYMEEYHPTRLIISREELEKLVREKTIEQVSIELGFATSVIWKKCKSLGIENPGKGYWNKLSLDEQESRKKLHVAKEELARLVWKMPMTDVASKYGVAANTIKKRW